MTRVRIVSPRGEQFDLTVGTRPTLFGRAEDCDFVMRHDAEVSRHHAKVWLDDQNRIVVQDNGSKNGTRVDDGEAFRKDQRFAFHSIRIGEHEVRILGVESAPNEPIRFAPDLDVKTGDTQFFPSTRRLDLSAQRLQLLIQMTERIGGRFERTELLEEALTACCDALGFERGLIVLKTHRGDTEHPVTRNLQRDESGAFKVSRTLVNRALIHGERAIVNNPATDLDGLTESLVRFPICSALCVPILHRGEVLGVIYGDRVTQGTTYQPADVDFLAAIAQQVGVGIANLRLFQDKVRAQAVYSELQRARVIQRKLLPAAPHACGKLRVEGYNEPSSGVSGDYFDHFDLEDGRVGMIIADVTGHGLPAALVMANLQSAVRVALSRELDLVALATRVNRLICRNTASDVFVTAILGVIDTVSGEMEYVNAGHPGPLLLGDGKVRVLEDEASLPLGVEENEGFTIVRVKPHPGCNAALFYTDGLTEAAGSDGALLGIQPVLESFCELPDPAPSVLIARARAIVRKHLGGTPPADDMTLLAIQYQH